MAAGHFSSVSPGTEQQGPGLPVSGREPGMRVGDDSVAVSDALAQGWLLCSQTT